MSKHVRKILPLLLCLLLMACLLPAAYADGVEVSTLEQLQAALADQKRDIRLLNAGDVTLTGDLTVPEGVYLKVRENSRLIVPEGKTLTINGKIEASGGDGKIDVAGTMTTKMNQGEIELCNGGVLNVTGTLENNKTIFLGHNNQPDEAKPRLTIKAGAAYTGGTLTFRNNVTPNEVVEGIDLDACSFHHIQAASVTIYAPYGKENVEACLVVGRKAVDYLELRGIEEYRLSADIEIPVLDDGTVSKADMHATRLVVPDEKSVIVNGELAVKELVIENGGSVTVNGYLDAVNGITLNNGGALTVNNTHIDAGYVPTTDIEALKNIVYIGDANLLLHLVVWPSDDVPNAIRTASNAVDENVNCMVELRTDWTVDEAFDAHLITLRVRKGRTLTVNGELIVKELVVEDGGNVVIGDGGSITYAAGSDIEALRDAIANPAISQFELRGNPFTITEALTIPSDFTVIVGSGSSLEIPAGVALNLKGRLILREGAVLNVLQTSSANRGRIIGGTLEVDTGSTVNLMGRLEIDKLRLDGTLTTQNSGVWYEFELTDLDNGRPRGRMIISNGGSHSVSSNGLDEAKLQEWVSFEGDQAYLEIAYPVKSDQDLTEMTQRIRNLPARFQGSARLRYGAVIWDDYIFPGIQIRVDGSSGGSLTIAEGAVLTAPTVYLKGAELTVNGTFISIPRDNNHNGAVILQGNTSRLTVTDTGIIGGTDCTIEIGKEITDPEACLDGVKFSQLQDISDPIRAAAGFLTYRFIPELSLPAALNTIESEAFAGGSFSSVYIPAGVTSIAPDAFGDRTHLKVYGEYGTAAETFADGHGFPFAPLAWRGNQ